MGFKCGIVGLPNVGKSTLFNALTQTQAAQAANYPFCTIEPNVGQVAVPDERLDKIAAIAKSAKILPTQLAFVDIAGLVKGASQGEGLGNQFLGNIREVDAIVHVLRCFEDDDIVHVEGRVDPVADAETVETELLLADLESLEKRVPNLQKKGQGGDKDAKAAAVVLSRALDLLRDATPKWTHVTIVVDETIVSVYEDGEARADLFTQAPNPGFRAAASILSRSLTVGAYVNTQGHAMLGFRLRELSCRTRAQPGLRSRWMRAVPRYLDEHARQQVQALSHRSSGRF